MSIKIIRNFMDVAPVRKKSLAIYTWESTISILRIGYTQKRQAFLRITCRLLCYYQSIEYSDNQAISI